MSILLSMRGMSAQKVEKEEINVASNILGNKCSLISIDLNCLSSSAKKQISLSSLGHYQLNEGHLDPKVSNNVLLDSVSSSTNYFHG